MCLSSFVREFYVIMILLFVGGHRLINDVVLNYYCRNLGTAMEQDGLRQTEPLTRALAHTGDTYDKIAMICEDQPRLDLEPLGDVLHDYRGLLSSFPDIITVHKVHTVIHYTLIFPIDTDDMFRIREHYKNGENWNARR